MQEANARTGHLRHAAQVAMGEYTPESLNEQPPETEETSVLSVRMPQEPERRKSAYTGRFIVTKEVLFVHTDRFI